MNLDSGFLATYNDQGYLTVPIDEIRYKLGLNPGKTGGLNIGNLAGCFSELENINGLFESILKSLCLFIKQVEDKFKTKIGFSIAKTKVIENIRVIMNNTNIWNDAMRRSLDVRKIIAKLREDEVKSYLKEIRRISREDLMRLEEFYDNNKNKDELIT